MWTSLQNNEIYNILSKGEYFDGMEDLPIVDILDDLQNILKEWNKFDDFHFEKDNEMIEVFTTSQFVRFSCYQLTEQHLNDLIGLMLEYECPLYDTAIEVRFEG